MHRSRILGFAILTLVLATAVSAEDNTETETRRQGFFIGFGFGGGWEGFFGNEGRGGAGYFRLGGTVTEHLTLGFEVIGLTTDDSDRDHEESRGNLAFTALYYPKPAGNWFVKTGVGAASHQVGPDEVSGVGVTFGSGFDFRLSRGFSITPNVDYLVQFFDHDTVGALLFTVGASWH